MNCELHELKPLIYRKTAVCVKNKVLQPCSGGNVESNAISCQAGP